MEAVRRFLLKFKQVATQQGIVLIRRPDTIATLTYLGLTKRNVEEVILSLSVQNYTEGPVPDDKGRTGELWVFGCEARGCEVYIKLKLAEAGSRKIAKCISFHIPRYPMNFPFKTQTPEID